MKNQFDSKMNNLFYKILFITFFINTILGGCKNSNMKVSLSATGETNSIRKTTILSDNWQFIVDVRDLGEKEQWFSKEYFDWGSVKVPGAWDCYEDALWQYQGIGWYTTSINSDDFILGKKIEIVFGRVMQYCKIWLNGEFIGENIGGYLPFSFDITSHLKPNQENRLVLRVDNRARIEWLPAAEQIEWIQYGGILEPVKLISKSYTYVDDLTIVSKILDNQSARINCMVNIANETTSEVEIDLDIKIKGNSNASSQNVKVICKPHENTNVNLDFTLQQAELWSPDSPFLYSASIILSTKGKEIDNLSDRFGIRQVSVRDTSIILNGKLVKIKGVNRYDTYDRFGPNPPEHLVREELSLMKRVGINTIRVHYSQSPELLSLYDEYGFLMMEEIPLNWWGIKHKPELQSIGGRAEQSFDILNQAKSTLTDMIRRDKNHPCIIIWSMANECVTDNEVGITVMRELLKLAKKLDPTRLVTFVVGNSPVSHLGFDEADLVCFTAYPICEHISQIDSVCYYLLAKHLERYRNYYGSKPIVMAEFGREGIKNIHGDVFYCEEFQAAYIESMWRALEENTTISGGILWCWADYFHERHFALTSQYAPYGVVTGDRKHKKSLETLARMYGGCIPEDKRNP